MQEIPDEHAKAFDALRRAMNGLLPYIDDLARQSGKSRKYHASLLARRALTAVEGDSRRKPTVLRFAVSVWEAPLHDHERKKQPAMEDYALVGSYPADFIDHQAYMKAGTYPDMFWKVGLSMAEVFGVPIPKKFEPTQMQSNLEKRLRSSLSRNAGGETNAHIIHETDRSSVLVKLTVYKE